MQEQQTPPAGQPEAVTVEAPEAPPPMPAPQLAGHPIPPAVTGRLAITQLLAFATQIQNGLEGMAILELELTQLEAAQATCRNLQRFLTTIYVELI